MSDNTFRERKVLSDPIRVMDARETTQYLDRVTTEEVHDSKELWKQFASRKAMANFLGSPYTLDRLQYYQTVKGVNRNIARKIPYESIKLDVIRFSKGIRMLQRALAQQLIKGKLTGQEWYDSTKHLTKVSLKAAYMVEEGGYDEFLTQERVERWLIGATFAFVSLNSVAEKLVSGDRELNGRLLLDADNLADNVYTTFENWRLAWAINNGLGECRRVLGHSESCHNEGDRPGCVELADKGFIPIWKVIPIGAAACYAKCHCILEYR